MHPLAWTIKSKFSMKVRKQHIYVRFISTTQFLLTVYTIKLKSTIMCEY
jgi:hypothetical protein